MGFLSVPNLVRWLIFRALIVSDQLYREGIKEKEDDEKVWRGGGAIIRARRLIEGRILFQEIRYFCCDYSKEIKIVKCSSSAFNIAVQLFCLFVCLFVFFFPQSEKKIIEISLFGTLIVLKWTGFDRKHEYGPFQESQFYRWSLDSLHKKPSRQ